MAKLVVWMLPMVRFTLVRPQMPFHFQNPASNPILTFEPHISITLLHHPAISERRGRRPLMETRTSQRKLQKRMREAGGMLIELSLYYNFPIWLEEVKKRGSPPG